jgi:HAD superfamily hydrolase (TIGR01490 family)
MANLKEVIMNNFSICANEKSFVFFDVDDTLISIKSMLSFQDFWYQKYTEDHSHEKYYADLRQQFHPDACWMDLNRRYYRYFSGRKVTDVRACGEEWFLSATTKVSNFFHPLPLAELRAHQQQGREIVFVSGSFPALLRPIANYLQVRNILATTMEIAAGCYTGNILEPQTIGEGKAEAIRMFLTAMGTRANGCYAYGDDLSDMPMLRAVGNPTVVRGGRELEVHAVQLGWRIISPTYG